MEDCPRGIMNRLIAAIFGVIYLAAGIAGFILTSPLFGLFPVNTLHDIVHVVLGAILLWGMMNTASAIMANRWVGVRPAGPGRARDRRRQPT